MKKYVLLTVTVAMATAIFLFSSQSKVDSHALSDRVVKVVSAQLTQVENRQPGGLKPKFNRLVEDHLRKIAHVGEYALFGFLLMGTFTCFHVKHAGLWAFVTGVAFGATDELHQLLTQTRDARLWDVGIDAGGVALGIGLAAGCLWIVHRRRKRLLHKRETVTG